MINRGLILPLLYEPARHIYRLMVDAAYRQYHWISFRHGWKSRYRESVISVRGYTLLVPDVASFLAAFKEIFVERIYDFRAGHDEPVLLDCGANIGLSVLFFKEIYPKAKITAYEADPHIFRLLQRNIRANGVGGVELVNKAIWSHDTTLEFSVEGADGGRVRVGDDGDLIAVQAVGFAAVLASKQYDFIKMDIEGAEVEALSGCRGLLEKQGPVFVEFHSFSNRRQDLGRLIEEFEQAGYRVHIHPPYTSKRPFLGIKAVDGMDMQLNLFFWKPGNEAA